MRAAVLVETGKIAVKDVQPPEPKAGEVLVRVIVGGICGSDHSLYHGKFGVPLPVIPGHEASGRIEKLGSGVSGLTVGQRVTIQPNLSCFSCPLCRSGHQNICPAKLRLGVDTDGVFAEYVKVPSNRLWSIPEGLEDDAAVFAEPAATAVHALKIMAPRKGDRTLILGAGVMGLLILQLVALEGAEVTACDFNQKRLALAKKLGAAHVIDASDQTASIHSTFDLIYETSGADAALAQAIRFAAPLGRIVVLGLPGKEHAVSPDLIVRKELQIRGSMIYSDEFPQALKLLQSGDLQTEPLISKRLQLDELDGALSRFGTPERVKMLVVI